MSDTPLASLPAAIMASDVPSRARKSLYPHPFAAMVAGREKKALGQAFGLTVFGVNLTRLAPGAWSALRHAHTRQDEFVYVLEGHPVLYTNAGRTPLSPGMCAGFPAGTGNAHHLVNESTADVLYLEIGDRTPGDEASYADDDLMAREVDGAWQFLRKDGSPIDDSIRIRSLQPEDALPAQQVILDILNGEFGMDFTLDELPDIIDLYGTYVGSREGQFWVATRDGAVVGCLGVLRLAGADFELRRMYVNPRHRGLRIAQRLLEELMAWCHSHEVANLYLETNEQWKAAHHIYEKMGFVPVTRAELPPTFPVVRVATGFYRLCLHDSATPAP